MQFCVINSMLPKESIASIFVKVNLRKKIKFLKLFFNFNTNKFKLLDKFFLFLKDSQILVTGGVDFLIKVWNPFITKKAKITFHGHQAPISAIFIQNNGKRIFSLSQDRCIRVFDVFSRTCMQV